MARITIKDTPKNLQTLLKREAVINTKRDQKWIEEALGSGAATPLSRREMDAIHDRVLKRRTE